LSSWSKKDIRQTLGIIMMFSFIWLAMDVYILLIGLSVVGFSLLNIVMVVFEGYSIWMPNVCLIVIIYLLLTRVWKYK
jgi:hypothetical protein